MQKHMPEIMDCDFCICIDRKQAGYTFWAAALVRVLFEPHRKPRKNHRSRGFPIPAFRHCFRPAYFQKYGKHDIMISETEMATGFGMMTGRRKTQSSAKQDPRPALKGCLKGMREGKAIWLTVKTSTRRNGSPPQLIPGPWISQGNPILNILNGWLRG